MISCRVFLLVSFLSLPLFSFSPSLNIQDHSILLNVFSVPHILLCIQQISSCKPPCSIQGNVPFRIKATIKCSCSFQESSYQVMRHWRRGGCRKSEGPFYSLCHNVLYHFDLMFASRVTGVPEHERSHVLGGSELPMVEGHGR